MTRYLTLILLLAVSHIFAQKSDLSAVPNGTRNTVPLTEADADAFRSIERISLPESYRGRSLPDSIDNSKYIWFRPIFSQTVFPNCMQSTSIAYNFTYEINRLRNLPASDSNNQYPTHFAWNFFNGGNGWYGVNYLFTMDVLKHHGTPSVADYGGFYYGNGERWMSGYDKWYNAMNNRISKVRSIYVGDEEGLLILKHWLNDHLDGSETGGVASFIACSPYGYQPLPPESPHTGESVMVAWCNEPLHGMTIVGYNDSIRFDYNGDGQFTNDLDINGDGNVDMKDWEIGAVKFANSYGDNFANDGYCFMMYKTLADDIQEGGIWMNTVHVLDVKESHDTRMTFKVSLEHNYREKIRVRAGISADIQSSFPEHIQGYTIFNYQGGWHYMQGNDTIASNKTIEFGLDVTPLLSYVEPGQPCKFFLIVDERDEENYGTGQVNYFSLMDYTGSVQEIACDEQNIGLTENGTTMLSVVHTPAFDKVSITTEELPLYEPGQEIEMQMAAQGGQPPYTWSLDKNFIMNITEDEFPQAEQEKIMSNSYNDTIVVKKLDFSFPFYGNTFDSVFVSSSGYLYFDENMYFWSYLVDMAYFLKNNRVVAPLLCQDMVVYEGYGNGIWYEGDTSGATFRWNTDLYMQAGASELNFAVKLYPDGDIEFYYGDIEMNGQMRWVAGIADGDNLNYSLPQLPFPTDIEAGTKVEFIAAQPPSSLYLSEQGLLTIKENEAARIADVGIIVTDNTLLSDRKGFQLTDGPEIWIEVDDDSANKLLNGQLNELKLNLKNRSSNTLNDLVLELSCDHPLISMQDGQQVISGIQPGQTLTIPAAFTCVTGNELSDRQNIVFGLSAAIGQSTYQKNFSFMSSSPSLELHDFTILNQNGLIEPGSSANLEIRLINTGSRTSSKTMAFISCNDPGITIGETELAFGDIAGGGVKSAVVNISADYSIYFGHEVDFNLEINDEYGLTHEAEFNFRIGRVPVCVIDLDPERHSGPNIHGLLQEMGVESAYTQSFPTSLLNFQSVIICLGIQFSYHEVSWQENLIMQEYLDQGGNIYMESRVHWRMEDNYGIFDRFNIDTEAYPGLYEIVDGVDSTFTEGLSYMNIATQPFCYFNLKPVPPAYSIYTGRTYPYCAAVAYDAGSYKTIGTIFELGSLIPSDTCLVETYMQEVLDFFGIVESSLGIEEAKPEADRGELLCFPNPFSGTTQIPLLLEKDAYVKGSVYDLQGRLVKEILPARNMQKGSHNLSWDGKNSAGKDMPAGIYIFSVQVDSRVMSGKMVLIP